MPIVNDYLNIARGLSPEGILQSARNQLLEGSSIGSKDFSGLEAYLNSVFYGPKGNNTITSRLQEVATKYYEDQLQQTFDNYDFESDFFSDSGGATDGKIALNERTAFSHKQFIGYNTVWKRFEEARIQLENLGALKDPAGQYTQIISDLQQLMNVATMIMDEPYMTTVGNNKVIMVNAYTKDLIARLDELYQKVTFAASLPLKSAELGEVFEKALHVVGSGRPVDELTNEMMYETFSQKTAGSQIVARGGLIQLTGIDYKVEAPKNKKHANLRYQITGENGSVFTIGGEFDAKQGKMDVLFTMPNSLQQFRISAKNWKTLDGRDFGSTDLEGAMVRSGGVINTIGFGVGVGFSRSNLQNAHDYAKACAILDILMGYSQSSAYADTVVINDRSSAQIKVYSMYDLLKNINYDSLIGYPNDLRSAIRSNFNVKRKLSIQAYENTILSTLKGYKLTLSSKILG